uniref:Uncharacterized protein n=1 Tax=Octopus bimaculoides TaxID=37653 RepID=A0A0L8GH29_OCTBM
MKQVSLHDFVIFKLIWGNGCFRMFKFYQYSFTIFSTEDCQSITSHTTFNFYI